jgi:hypothetical protein
MNGIYVILDGIPTPVHNSNQPSTRMRAYNFSNFRAWNVMDN